MVTKIVFKKFTNWLVILPKTSETADLGQYKHATTKTADHSSESTVGFRYIWGGVKHYM